MKKTLALLLAVLMLTVAFVGCGGSESEELVSQRSIPTAVTSSTLTSTKFTMDVTPTSAWQKETTNVDLCFKLIGMSDETLDRTISARFLGTASDGKTAEDLFAEYKASLSNYDDAHWSEGEAVTYNGYNAKKYVGDMGMSGYAGRQDYISYCFDVEGEIFLFTLMQTQFVNGEGAHEMASVETMLNTITFTPIA